jgi:hypothetical protein
MPYRTVGRRACQRWLARGLGRLVVIVVNDDDLLGQTVLVEVGPVRVAPSVGGFGRLRVHVVRSTLREGRQLLGLSVVGGCGSARVWVGRAARVVVVHRVAYSSRAVCELRIGNAGLVSLVVGIKLMVWRECGRSSGGRRHGVGVSAGTTAVERGSSRWWARWAGAGAADGRASTGKSVSRLEGSEDDAAPACWRCRPAVTVPLSRAQPVEGDAEERRGAAGGRAGGRTGLPDEEGRGLGAAGRSLGGRRCFGRARGDGNGVEG